MQNYASKRPNPHGCRALCAGERAAVAQVGNIFGISVNTQNSGRFERAGGRGRVRPGQRHEHVQLRRQGLLEQHHPAGHVEHIDGGRSLEQRDRLCRAEPGERRECGGRPDYPMRPFRVRLNPLGLRPGAGGRTPTRPADPEGPVVTAHRRRRSWPMVRWPRPASQPRRRRRTGGSGRRSVFIVQTKPGATQFTGGGASGSFQYHGTGVVPHSSSHSGRDHH